MTPRLLISAAHKSSGKTTVSLGLCAALKDRKLKVRPFKKGPDYIDPMWLASAAGNACYNLDFYTMSHDEILAMLFSKSDGFDISVMEANKGLYDGTELDGSNSNAALAKLTQTPVVLVINTRGISRGIAPLLLGYQAFDPDINIAGVILNQVGGPRHEGKLRTVVEHYTDIPVLGAVQRHHDLELTERHLGLVPSNEAELACKKINAIKSHIADQVDIDRIIEIANTAPAIGTVQRQENSSAPLSPEKDGIRLGIIQDAAFGFYYADDLDTFEAYGVELIKIDALRDTALPDIDALFIGGGFPETHLAALHDNQALRQAIFTAIENNLPTYAECGGLMYLCKNIQWNDLDYEMVGIIPATATMHVKPQGRGYIQLQQNNEHPWLTDVAKSVIAAHEFHYSSISALPENSRYAFKVKRGSGIDGKHDGYLYKNLLACYAHQRHTASNPWIKDFIRFVQATTNN